MKLLTRLADIHTLSALLKGAEAEARADGEDELGAEHVLLSALALAEGSARRAFESISADPDALREAIAAQHDDALRAVGIEPLEGHALPHGGPGARDAQPRLYRAASSGQALIRSIHDLHNERKGDRARRGARGAGRAAGMEHGTAARALRAMGVDRHALASAARREIEG